MKTTATSLLMAIALCAIAALPIAGANGALVQIGDLVLEADGGFTPQKLPRRTFAPIDFKGHADLSTRSGAMPPALQQAVIDFDRDGRMSTGGLPSCSPDRVADASPEVARQACAAAIVGTGRIGAVVALAGQPPEATGSLLTLFNGPPQDGHATVVAHAQITNPVLRTFAILIPVERRRGRFRYRATLNVPPIVPEGIGTGALTHVDAKIGRRYRANGKRRSYVSARCSDNVLETHGRFTFNDGTVIDGSVMKGCFALR
ncbi:MAG TPA: hypothetical protein VNM89_02330 [Solirubrobacterales bacterium]|nr:hypothetical protein [Solirubrobacterales bacterium]